jgi:hypothetical protein
VVKGAILQATCGAARQNTEKGRVDLSR